MNNTKMPAKDGALRFLFEEADIRGQMVRLDRAFADIVALHQYAPAVSRLLGEFLAASVLLSSTLKFAGKLILQARSNGQVPLLMAECDNQYRLRAIARGAEQATAERFEQLLEGGQLVITIDPQRGQRYQGIAPLVNDSLAASLDAYFQQSEQLRTRFWLSCEGTRAAGLLLQQLPEQVTTDQAQREQQWLHALTLAETVSDRELLELQPMELVHRLYHEEVLRVFDPEAVSFSCDCSRERTLNALSALGPTEVEELLRERGRIIMDCEFCNQQYSFQREDLGEILQQAPGGTVH